MAFDVGAIVAHMKLDLKEWDKAVKGVNSKLKATSANFAKAGRSLTKGLSVPLLVMSGAALKFAADFDKSMTESLAIMGDVSDELRSEMEKTAKEMSENSTFAAKELAESYFFLASAGLDAKNSIAALPIVTKFAQAGNFDLSQATDLLTDAQSALGLSTKDVIQNQENMIRIGDVLVKANTVANASVQQFSESLTNRAAAALITVNKSLEEGVAVLSAFADKGIKGQLAGMQLSIVMTNLQTSALENTETFKKFNVEVFDSQGNMANMADIIGDLEGALEGMSAEQKISTLAQLGFNDRARQTILTLLGTSEKIRQYEKDLRDAGGTMDKVSKKQMLGFTNQMIALKNEVVNVAIDFGKHLLPIIRKLVENHIKPAVRWFKNLSDGQKELIVKVGLFVAAVGPLLTIFSKLLLVVPGLIKAFGVLKIAIAAIGGPISIVVAGLGFIAVEAIKARKRFVEFSNAIEERAQAGGEKIGWLEKTWTSLTAATLKWTHGVDLTKKVMKEMQAETVKLNKESAEYGKKIVEAVKGTNIYKSIIETVSGLTGIFSKKQEEVNESTSNLTKTIEEDLTPAIKEVKEETESWLDFLNNVGFKTFKQQQGRIVILQDHLKRLSEEYNKGEISLEAYRKATKAVNDEIEDLSTSVIDTAVPAVRDMSGVLDQAVDDMKGKIGEFPPVVEQEMTKIVDIMDTRWGDVIRGMSDAFGKFVFDVLSTGSTFAENLAGLWGGIKDTFKNVVADMAQEWVEKFLKKVLTETFNIGASIISSLAKTAKSAVDVAGEAAAGAAKSAAGTAKDVVSSIASVGSASSALLTGAGAAVGSFLGTALGSLVGKKTTGWQKAMQAIGLETVDFVHDLLNETMNFLHKLEPILWNTNEIKDNTRAILEASWSISEKISNLGKQNNAIFKVLESMAKSLNAIVKGGLAEGAIVNRPTIKLIGEQAPRIPEVVAPLPDFQRMLQTAAKSGTGKGGKVEIFVSNKVDLIGQIITDDEHTRRRLIPLIMQALKTNIGMTELTDILKAKGVI